MPQEAGVPTRFGAALVAWLLAACSVLTGCATALQAPGYPNVPELVAVPFFPQTDYDCGPAALATVINAAGTAVSPAELIERVYIEGLRGSLQAELMAATRRYGLVPVQLEPQFDDLLAEVAGGRPVLVLQNLGLEHAPVWHYAVVVGFDAERRRVILRSGEEPRRRVRTRRFLREWRLADNWAFVASPPNAVPVSVSAERYMRVIVGSQQQLGPRNVSTAFDAALTRWPEDPLVLFLTAIRKQEAFDLPAAAALYRKVLAIEPFHVAARNNLANVLLDQGCRSAALQEARLAAVQEPSQVDFAAAVQDTLTRIESAPADRAEPQTCTTTGW